MKKFAVTNGYLIVEAIDDHERHGVVIENGRPKIGEFATSNPVAKTFPSVGDVVHFSFKDAKQLPERDGKRYLAIKEQDIFVIEYDE